MSSNEGKHLWWQFISAVPKILQLYASKSIVTRVRIRNNVISLLMTLLSTFNYFKNNFKFSLHKKSQIQNYKFHHLCQCNIYIFSILLNRSLASAQFDFNLNDLKELKKWHMLHFPEWETDPWASWFEISVWGSADTLSAPDWITPKINLMLWVLVPDGRMMWRHFTGFKMTERDLCNIAA